MYALESLIGGRWQRLVLCGKRSLLERIQSSFARQEERRIVYVAEFPATSVPSAKAA